MPIKFVDLFQQSWNFMRNQQSFTLFAIATIVVVQMAFILLLPASPEILADTQPQQIQIDSEKLLSVLMPTILLGVANLFLTVLMILNIQSINNGNYQHIF